MNYLDDEGIPDDWDKAVRAYRAAAEQGDARGQRRLGYCYLQKGDAPPSPREV